ncbi:MAG: ABC transporter permease, partial [Clostridiales bacterium]
MIISVVIGITAGIVAAINRNNIFDHITRVFVLIGTILPPFWLGLLLIYFFFFLAGVAPAPSGRLPMGANFVADGTGFILVDTLMAGRVDLFWMALKQMTLPVITIVLETLAAICKLTRSSMISTMNMEYIKMARASGIPSTIIDGRYSLKNGLLPVITSVGMTFSFAVGGEVLVEKIFSWPGIGLYAIKALGVSDYPAIQGFVLTCALIYLVVFLIVDLLYFAVDPRIKY